MFCRIVHHDKFKFIVVLPWLVGGAVFVWLFFNRYPISGQMAVESNLDGKSPWINSFLPAERVTKPGSQAAGWTGQRILDEPVYATALSPGAYDSVDVALEYRTQRQPFLEFGLVRDETGKDLELRPMYSSQLETDDWQAVKLDGQPGFMRSGVAVTRPNNAYQPGLAVWDATSGMPLLADPIGHASDIPVSLRGEHDFYFVPAGGEIRVRFTLQNSNRRRKKNPVALRVYRGQTELRYEAVGFSGEASDMQRPFTHEILISSATPGVYRVSLIADDNMFIRKIWTTSQHWVVGPRLYLGDTIGYAAPASTRTTIFTKALQLTAQTFHIAGLQTIMFGERVFTLKRTHEVQLVDRSDRDEQSVSLLAPRGDVRFVLAGFAAFSQAAYFDPLPRKLMDATDLSAEKIETVLTSYQRPERLANGWLRSTMSFKLDQQKSSLWFVLSAPGLKARDGAVDVRWVKLTYRRGVKVRPSLPRLLTWLRPMRHDLGQAWSKL